ncbi:hypothetical protein T581_00763, partial [Mycobacterium tuberculosis UT0048]
MRPRSQPERPGPSICIPSREPWRWGRAFRSATEWKGHAAQVTTGAARAVNMYPQPGTL